MRDTSARDGDLLMASPAGANAHREHDGSLRVAHQDSDAGNNGGTALVHIIPAWACSRIGPVDKDTITK